VNQGRRLKSMVGAFPPQLIRRHAAKIGIQQIEKAAFRGSVTVLNSPQKL